ncbi:MAG: hypothetical protein UH542_00795 [Bacteroidales bacterium]|nr:hypothetical protein [Bacteroidales bacterium]
MNFKKIAAIMMSVCFALSFASCTDEAEDIPTTTSPNSTIAETIDFDKLGVDKDFIYDKIDISESVEVKGDGYGLSVPAYKEEKTIKYVDQDDKNISANIRLFSVNGFDKDKMFYGVAEYTGSNLLPHPSINQGDSWKSRVSNISELVIEQSFKSVIKIGPEFARDISSITLESSAGYNRYACMEQFKCYTQKGDNVYSKGFMIIETGNPIYFFACDYTPAQSYDGQIKEIINNMKDSFSI